MIDIINLKKDFGKLEVLKGVDLSLRTGKTTAILGPNGSGKTTLIKSILGMVRPTSGEIYFNDEPVFGRWKYRHNIGYLPQIARFPENLSIRELIGFVENLRGQQSNSKPLIDLFDLEAELRTKLRYLSGGTRQKVNLVLTFMFDCPVYILDEPTSGLDPVALIRLKDLIEEKKGQGKTFIITTHIMNLVEEIADELIFILEGKIFYQGTFEGLMESQHEINLERAIAKILSEKNAQSIKI